MKRAACAWLVVLLPLAAVEVVPLVGEPVCGQVIAWRIDGMPEQATAVADGWRLVCNDADGSEVAGHPFRWQQYRSLGAVAEGLPQFAQVGEPEWRVRHVAHVPGPLRWALFDPAGEAVATGELSVAASEQACGVIGVAEQGRLLSRAGQAFVPVSTNICWANAPDRWGRMRHYIDSFAAAGGSHIRVWMASWFGQVASDVPDRYRLDHAWLIDRVFEYAAERGVLITLVLDNAHDLVHGDCAPYGEDVSARIDGFFSLPLSEQYQRRLDYLVARYAAYDNLLAWELFNELDEALIGQPKPMHLQDEPQITAAWTRAASDALRQRDPYDRLITTSLAMQPWYDNYRAPAIDLVPVHGYLPPLADIERRHRDGVALMQEWLRPVLPIGKPASVAECGYQGANEDNAGNFFDPAGVLLQHQAWGGLLVGGWTTGMNWWWDVYIDRADLWHIYRPIRRAVDFIDWNDKALAPLSWPKPGQTVALLGWRSPTQALIWPRLASDTWYRQVIKAKESPRWPSPQDRLLQIPGFAPHRDFNVQVLDMDTGTVDSPFQLTSSAAGTLLLQLPGGTARSVLLIRDRGGAAFEELD